MNQNFSHDQTSFSRQAHLTDYLNIIRKRKWVVITFLLVVVFIVSIKTSRTTPVYKATSQVIIETESSFMEDMANVTNYNIQAKAYYETQYKLLMSRSLASKVIEDLRLGEYLANRDTEKPDYLTLVLNKVKTKLSTNINKVRSFIGSFTSSSGHDASEIQSNEYIEQGEGEGNEYVPKKRDWLVDWYLSNLEIVPMRQTSLVYISFSNQSPEIVARVANAHARAFIERNNQIQHLASQQAIDWLKEQLRGQKIKVGTSQQTLNKYKYEQLMTFSINNENFFSLPEIKQNPVIQELRGRLAKLKTQKIEMTTKYGYKHPKIIETSSSIMKTEQEIVNEVHRIRMSIKAEMDLAAIIEKPIHQTQDMQQVGVPIGEKASHYDMLKLEAEGDQEIYDILLKQAKEINLTGNMERRNIRIVDEAEVPHSPFKPKIFFNILLSVVMGLTFGVGFAFFFEYMSKTMTTPEDIVQHMGMTILGILPYDRSLKRKRNGMLALPLNGSNHKQKKRIGYYGQYDISGSLVTSLPLKQARMFGQIFMVESSRASEGKTTVLVKSAINLARGGSRVLMVDVDLQRPYLHRMFGFNDEENSGLINAMTGILSQDIRQGTLDKCSVDDLFSLIGVKKQSGQLIITNDTQSMTAVFENGLLSHLQSQDIPLDNRLGTMLLRGGFITENQLKDALERVKRTGQPLGYILINAGYVNQDKLRGPLKLQMEEHLHKLFSWKQGTFVFEPGRIEPYEDKRIYFQEDYVPIIKRLGRMGGSRLLESEVLSYTKSLDEPNLSLLTCGIGHLRPDSTIFIALLAKFFDLLKQRFDVILVDAPPVIETMGNVRHLISLVDNVIYVVQSGRLSIKDIKEATNYLKEEKSKIVGVILNQVKIGRGSYNDYGYYAN